MSGRLTKQIDDLQYRLVSLRCSRRVYAAEPAALQRVEEQIVEANRRLAELEALAEETRLWSKPSS